MRKIVLGALALGIVYVGGRGALLSRYAPETSDAYLWGSFHVHSTMSDGLAPLEAIAEEARAARVDFVMLSDHGRPHREASLVDEVIEGVRFVGGSEVAIPEGHLIVSGARELPLYHLPPYPPDAIEDAREWGGLAVVTYPDDPLHRWGYWEEDLAPDGLEIINVTSDFRAGSIFDKLDWALFSVFQPLYYVSALSPPGYALARWDELLERAPVFAFYASNAHGGFPVTEERFLGVPSYRTAFTYVGLGVPREHAEDPMAAIRRGDFFALVRGAGEPGRFDFSARVDGERRGGGSAVPAGSDLAVELRVDELVPRIVLQKDGERVEEIRTTHHVLHEAEPGTYRVEVYLVDHPLLSPDVPWILSNPIFVGGPPNQGSAPEPSLECISTEPLPLHELAVETDADSVAWRERRGAEGIVLSYQIAKSTPEVVDRWVALALRNELDFAGSKGIVLEASGPEPMRYWIEVRRGDESYYASFKVAPGEARTLVVPWSRFYRTLGGRERPPLSALDSLFITVNTSSSRTGFVSSLELRSLGVCR